jgi:hypothetical protein
MADLGFFHAEPSDAPAEERQPDEVEDLERTEQRIE